MERVKIDLKHCYGIKALRYEFDFARGGAYAVYAPNGSMKSSLAQTFKDVATGVGPKDRIFPARPTACSILDENGTAISGSRVLVFGPYDPQLQPSEKSSTLLVNTELRAQHQQLRGDIENAKNALVAALKKQAATKSDIEMEISSAIMRRPGSFELAMNRIKDELQAQVDAPFANVKYDIIFNDAVLKALGDVELCSLIEAYTTQYNALLAKSVFFKKGTFDYYNAAEVAKSLASQGFFKAKHTVRLYGASEPKEIADRKELEALIEEEKTAILSDPKLREIFDKIFKQLHTNAALRAFAQYVSQPENQGILSRLDQVEAFRQDIFKSYIKANDGLYADLISKIEAARSQEEKLRAAALAEKTRWAEVIDIFNDRFVVPFKLEVKNVVDVILGREPVPELGFKYIDADGKEEATVDRARLLEALSTGEKKAFFILNVIFEIETRKQLKQETLVIIDDVADSFDYQNKYAIIQYLMDIKAEGFFRQIIMTHNFDFFRTVSSRFVGYGHCLMTEKTNTGIVLHPARGIKNIFANDWKGEFFANDKKKLASIPFLRNLVEFTRGDTDPDYIKLTSMLHWKPDTAALTVTDLDALYCRICGGSQCSLNGARTIVDLLEESADDCLVAPAGMNFENKVVLAMAVRMRAERYMAEKINDPAAIAKIESNQTHGLLSLFKKINVGSAAIISVLDRVSLVTPENIHLNSFMYEPIIDMSDEQLRRLWMDVKALA